jgi:hypothetical protein
MSNNNSPAPAPISHVLNIDDLPSYKPLKKQKYLLMAYYLLPTNIIKKHDDKLYGVSVFIGGYNNKETAKEDAKKYFDENKELSPLFRICESGIWFPLTPIYNSDDIDFVDDDDENKDNNFIKDIKLHDEYEKQQRHLNNIKEINEKKEYKKTIDKELSDKNSILYYCKLKYKQQILKEKIKNLENELLNSRTYEDELSKKIDDLDNKFPDYRNDYINHFDKI